MDMGLSEKILGDLISDTPEWMWEGNCANLLSESPFDADTGESLCDGCPVLEQCEDRAVKRQAVFGIWGGRHRSDGS